MEKDIEVLNRMKKIVDMGIIGIEEVMKKIDDKCLERIMNEENKEYIIIRRDIIRLLEERDSKGEKIGVVTRISNDIYTNMKLMNSDVTKEVAKMMIEGTNKGILEITCMLKDNEYDSKEIREVMEKLLHTLECNVMDLKEYL